MPRFQYTGLNQSGGKQVGEIDAIDETAALAALRERMITPLEIQPYKERRNVEDYFAGIQRTPYKELVIITRQLATMINAGITVLAALSILEEQQTNRKLKLVLGAIVDDVEAGESIADAFMKHPECFDELYVSVLRAGESSGTLDASLDQLAQGMERNYKLKRQVRSAMTYPLVVLFVALVVLIFMLVFLVPTFVQTFQEENAELPGLTQLVVKASEVLLPPDNKILPISMIGMIAAIYGAIGIATLVRNRAGELFGILAMGISFVIMAAIAIFYTRELAGSLGVRVGSVVLEFNASYFSGPKLLAVPVRVVMLLAILAGFVAMFRWTIRTVPGRRVWDTVKLNAPLGIGSLIQKIAIARFTRTFASLQRAGVPILTIFEIVENSGGNVLVAQASRNAAARVAAGGSMSEPLARANVFPPMVTRMIAVGEQTGTVDLMLEKIADFYEGEVEASLKSLSSIIEPIMIIFIGAMVGTIVISLYLPIFRLTQVLGEQAAPASMISMAGLFLSAAPPSTLLRRLRAAALKNRAGLRKTPGR